MTKSVVDQRMLVLVLCGWIWGSPAVAASPPPRPLIKRIDAALCDIPSNVTMIHVPSPRVGIIGGIPATPRMNYADGVYATAARLLWESPLESKPMDRIAALTRSIALAPNYQMAYRERARLYESEQQFDRALADYDRAFQLQPNDFNLLAAQGLLYANSQQWKKLIAIYDRLHGIRPDRALHYHTIQARAYAELQQWQEAIQQYTFAIQLDQLKDDFARRTVSIALSA